MNTPKRDYHKNRWIHERFNWLHESVLKYSWKVVSLHKGVSDSLEKGVCCIYTF